jgi:hypothetical protein
VLGVVVYARVDRRVDLTQRPHKIFFNSYHYHFEQIFCGFSKNCVNHRDISFEELKNSLPERIKFVPGVDYQVKVIK